MILMKPRGSLLISAFAVVERHLGDPDLAADSERLRLGQSDVGDLRLGEDRRGGLVVVEVAVLDGVQPHHVLGDLAALHRRHRGERQLPADVAGGVDVTLVRDAVVVDRDVATVVDLDPGLLEIQRVGVGHRTDRQHGVAGAHDAAVVAADHDLVAVAVDANGAGSLSSFTPRLRKSSSSTAATSGSLPGSTCCRLTISVTFEPNDENMWTNSTPVTPDPITVTLGEDLGQVAARSSGSCRRRAGTSRDAAAIRWR